MEHSTDLTTLQGRAEQFLQGLIHSCPPHDLARQIVNLATGSSDNPVKELFRTANSQTRCREEPAASTQPNASHRSKFSLRFGRKDKDRPIKPEPGSYQERTQQEFESVFQVGVKSGNSGSGNAPEATGPGSHQAKNSRSVFSSKGKGAAFTSTSSPYNCVFCHTDYSTKGTCKRHIEEIHVAKRFFRCGLCNKDFATVPEARKHTANCGAGVIGWTTKAPEPRKVYASEFVPHQLFKTQQLYINHLLDLSAIPKEERPIRSWHLKLRNLLEQGVCEKALCDLSVRLFGHSDGWRNVRWEHERVRKAVKEIECDKWQEEEDPSDMLRLHAMRNFIEDLFNDRALSTTVSASSPKAERAEPVQKGDDLEPDEEMPTKETQHVPTPVNEGTGKRPLSFESSAVAPERRPPGPPELSVYTLPEVSQERDYYQPHYHQQPVSAPISAPQETVTSQIPFETQQLGGQMIFWPGLDQQPPPYDSYTHTPLPQQVYTQNMLADSTYAAAGGFEGDYLGFADLSVASAVASPNDYMTPNSDAFHFHTNAPQQNYPGQPPAQQPAPDRRNTAMASYGFSSPHEGGGGYTNGTTQQQQHTQVHMGHPNLHGGWH